ncbi:tyrosine-protein phosphatase [Streptomyces sp. NPDC002851]
MSAIPAATVPNLRDLGGISLSDGRVVRSGRVLRSGQLNRFDPAADPVAASLDIRTVVDFRTDAERAAYPDRLPDGTRLLVADVFADLVAQRDTPAAAHLKQVLADPVRAQRELGGGRVQTLFADTYRAFVTTDSARSAFRTLLAELAAPPDPGPLLFHCTAGKDRTGWAATVLLTLLGADEETVRREYLAVNPAVREAFAPLIEGFTLAGGDPELALAAIGVVPAYLDAALEEVESRYGSMEKYVRDGLGIPDEGVTRIRNRLAT